MLEVEFNVDIIPAINAFIGLHNRTMRLARRLDERSGWCHTHAKYSAYIRETGYTYRIYVNTIYIPKYLYNKPPKKYATQSVFSLHIIRFNKANIYLRIKINKPKFTHIYIYIHADPDAEDRHQGPEQSGLHGQRQISPGRRRQEDLRRQGLPEERRPSGGARQQRRRRRRLGQPSQCAGRSSHVATHHVLNEIQQLYITS